MKDIAEVLEVSAPSLYNHVSSKQDLLFAIMDRAMDRAILLLEETLADITDVSEQLRLATEALVLDFIRHPAEITVCNTEIRSLEEPYRTTIVGKRDDYAQRIRAIVERGCAEGRFVCEDPRVASFAVLEMGNNAKAWFSPTGTIPAATVARMYGQFALRIVGDQRPTDAVRGAS
jgi:AcrR family transcriptional regulator